MNSLTFLLGTIFRKIISGYIVLEFVDSSYNKNIEVRENLLGRRNLVMGGLIQSGGAVEKIWETAISEVSNLNFPISNCLILGFGAGNAAKLVNKYYPKAKIIGVEIDPVVIGLGKKYFGLSEITNLETIIDNAIRLITNHSPLITKYDLILVDLYLGDKYPAGAESEEFINGLKSKLLAEGVIIFNRLYYPEKPIIDTNKFAEVLKSNITDMTEKKVGWNKLFICQP